MLLKSHCFALIILPRYILPQSFCLVVGKLTESSPVLSDTSGAVSKLAIPIGIPESFCRRQSVDNYLETVYCTQIISEDFFFFFYWQTICKVTVPYLHVVVQYFQKSVVIVVVQRGGEGGPSQEHGAGVIKVELLDWRR